jgi:acyl carrier protein
MTALEILKNAFVTGLGIDPDQTSWEELEYRSIPQWDSVAHMQVVAEIEDAFDIMLDIDDVIGMSSFDVSKVIVAKYGVDFD